MEKECKNCKHQECNAELYPCYHCLDLNTGKRANFEPKEKQYTDGDKAMEALQLAHTLICCMFAEGQEIAKDSLIAEKAKELNTYIQTRGY